MLGKPSNLSDKQLKAKIAEISNNLYEWRNLFLRLLPEVYYRRLWDDGKFMNVYHFAAVKACLSRDTVNRVINMHKRIVNFPSILNLFDEEKVGWSKIEIVASVLDKENEPYFAKRLLEDAASTLKRIVKKIKGKDSPEEEKPLPGANQDKPGDGTEKGKETTPLPASETTTDSKGNQTSQRDENTKTTAESDKGPICESCGHVAGDITHSSGGRELVTLHVDPLVADLYRRLLVEWKKKDVKVRMCDVLEKVALYAFRKGLDVEALLAASNKSSKQEQGGDKEDNTFPKQDENKWWLRQGVQVINYDVKTGACFTRSSSGYQLVKEQEVAYVTSCDKDPIDLAQMRLKAKKYAAEYLRKRLEEGKDLTDYIPVLIRDYLWLRSGGGFCEFPGCRNRAVRIHHLKRFELDPDCDPDGLIYVCQHCHDLFHDSAVANELRPFNEFRVRIEYTDGSPGEHERNRVDAAYRQFRNRYPQCNQLNRKSQRRRHQIRRS